MNYRSREVSPEVLEKDTEVVCVIDSERRIVYCNPAWDRFAAANGGAVTAMSHGVTGRSLFDFIPSILHAYFEQGLRTNAAAGFSLWTHFYECSTPSVYRLARMQTLSLRDTGEMLLAHAIIEERPHDRTPFPSNPELYVSGGELVMCVNCRKTLRNGSGATWDWVPEHMVRTPAPIVDGICEQCGAHYRLEAIFPSHGL